MIGPSDTVSKNCFTPERNTDENLDYYGELAKVLESPDVDPFTRMMTFAKYVPRQVLTDFLTRYEIFKLCVDIPGCVVECGVFRGQGLLSFAQFSAILEPVHVHRKVIGFDTFEGFPEIHEKDRHGENSHLVRGGYCAPEYDELVKTIDLYDQNRFLNHVPKVELVKGRVEESMPQFMAHNPHLVVALLYLDLDLYEPTKFAIETLRPRMPKGAIIAFDEVNCEQWPGETAALAETLGIDNVALKRFPFDSRICYCQLD